MLQLSRELQDIMREQQVALMADAVDDDVYHWDVWLSTFTPDCPLAEVTPLPYNVQSPCCHSTHRMRTKLNLIHKRQVLSWDEQP